MDRGDAQVARFLEKFADVCAKERMLVDYHGVYRPVGLSRRFPNIVNYEGIHGLEQMKWFERTEKEMMENDVRAFYLRLTAGPMDYTPGAMINHPLDGSYKGSEKFPGSVGTRCRQMALMAMYEAPLQMLCDSPTNYEKNMECFRFMASTPVVWTKTVGLGGCPDTYAAIARKAKDGTWYAAAITDAQARGIEFDTAAFLEEGEWIAEIFRDAPDADFEPTHYVHETKTVKRDEKILFNTAPGGGFVVKFTKK
jgi:alpha-glucosidase